MQTLITKHLSEGGENQKELHNKNIHQKLIFQSKCMACRNDFGSKLQEFNSYSQQMYSEIEFIFIAYNKEYYWKTFISY